MLWLCSLAWQLMTPELGGDIDESWFSANYDPTVQAALASSDNTFVIVDLVRPFQPRIYNVPCINA